MVEALLARGAPIDAVDKLGWTPLASAGAPGHEVAAGMLLRAGALPEVPDLVPTDTCECIAKTACEGMPELVASLLHEQAPSQAR